jgi:MFS family permease
VLTGLANTFTTIATYEEMHDPYFERYSIANSRQSEKLSDILSGLYNAGFSTGVIIGPFAASYLTLSLDSYRLQADYFGIFGVGFGILHFLVICLPRFISKKQKGNQSNSHH